MNQPSELSPSRPPDRAAVERLHAEAVACELSILRDGGIPEARTINALRDLSAMSLNLLQRLELAEQEKAEAVAQRDRIKAERDDFDAAAIEAIAQRDEAVALLRRVRVRDPNLALQIEALLAAYDAKER